MKELNAIVAELDGSPDEEQRELLEEFTGELTDNMSRIRQHGDRANRIIQDMLAMGRNTQGQYQTVSVNNLVEDHAMLAYQSARAQNPSL